MNTKPHFPPSSKVAFIVSVFFSSLLNPAIGQDTFSGTSITLSNTADSVLSLALSSYQAFEFDIAPLYDSLHSHTQEYEFRIQVDSLLDWNFILSQVQLFHPNFELYLSSERGDSLINFSTNNNFRGNLADNPPGTASFYVSQLQMNAKFNSDSASVFIIRPLRIFLPGSPRDQFVAFEQNDYLVTHIGENGCGFESEPLQGNSEVCGNDPQDHCEYLPVNEFDNILRTVEFAFDVDYALFDFYYDLNDQNLEDAIDDILSDVSYMRSQVGDILLDYFDLDATVIKTFIWFEQDPYTNNQPEDKMSQFHNFWINNRQCARQDVAFLLTHNLGGVFGAANGSPSRYSIVEPEYRIVNPDNSGCYHTVVHELMHNFGYSQHTTDPNDPCKEKCNDVEEADIMCNWGDAPDLNDYLFEKVQCGAYVKIQGISYLTSSFQNCDENEESLGIEILATPSNPFFECDESNEVEYTVKVDNDCEIRVITLFVVSDNTKQTILDKGDFDSVETDPGDPTIDILQKEYCFAKGESNIFKFKAKALSADSYTTIAEFETEIESVLTGFDDEVLITPSSLIAVGEEGVTTYLSDILDDPTPLLLSPSLACIPFAMNAQAVFLEGTLVIDEPWYCFKNDSRIEMAPGAKIIVESGSSLTIQETLVKGCEKMWEAIEVKEGGSLVCRKSKIADAVYAIKALPGSEVEVYKSEFEDNYVSLYFPADLSQVQEPTNLGLFAGNILKGSGSFKGSYPNQTTLPENFPYAGILAYDVESLDVSGFPNNINSYSNLTNGIVAFNTSLLVEHSKFNNIEEKAGSIYPLKGRAIYSNGQGNPHFLVQKGLGLGAVPTFFRCNYGIYTDGLHFVEIKDNFLGNPSQWEDLNNGFYTRSPLEVVIKNNYLTNVGNVGIRVHQPYHAQIIDNHIVVEQEEPAPKTPGAGIFISSNTWFGDDQELLIANNFIGVGGYSKGGILLNNTRNVETHTNDIRLGYINGSGDVNSYVGISIIGGEKNIIDCNSIRAQGEPSLANRPKTGISVNGSKENAIRCNTIDTTVVGINFYGMNDHTLLKGNSINNHTHGVLLGRYLSDESTDGLAWIGDQFLGGNLWWNLNIENSNPVPNNPIAGLVHLGSKDEIFGYIFIVTGGDDSEYIPSEIHPNELDEEWVIQQEDEEEQTFECIPLPLDVCTQYLEPDPIFDFGNLGDLDRAIINKDTIASRFLKEVTWTGEKHLYQRIMENYSAFSADTLATDFIADNQDSTFTILFEAENDIRGLYNAFLPEREGLRYMLDSARLLLQEHRRLNDTLLFAESPDTSAVISMRDSLISLSYDTYETSKLLHTEYSDSLAGFFEQFSTEFFNGLDTSETYVLNYKTVISIFLQTNGMQHINSLTSSQQDQLASIAHQCPLAYGDAVYIARALLDTIPEIPDEELCKSGASSAKKQNSPTSYPSSITDVQFFISPNPTDGDFSVKFTSVSESGILVIRNFLGQEVYSASVPNSVTEIQIPSSYLNSGIYFVSFYQKHFGSQTKLLNIID